MWKLRKYHFGEDISVLEAQEQRRVLAALKELKIDPYRGQRMKPLQSHQVHSRSLDDCWVTYLPGTYENELRIVYRIHPNGGEGGEVEVIAVGRRMGSEVYRKAMKRLTEMEQPRWARFQGGRHRRRWPPKDPQFN